MLEIRQTKKQWVTYGIRVSSSDLSGAKLLTSGDKSFCRKYNFINQKDIIGILLVQERLPTNNIFFRKHYLDLIHASTSMPWVHENLQEGKASISNKLRLSTYQKKANHASWWKYHNQPSCLWTFNDKPLSFFWRKQPFICSSLEWFK